MVINDFKLRITRYGRFSDYTLNETTCPTPNVARLRICIPCILNGESLIYDEDSVNYDKHDSPPCPLPSQVRDDSKLFSTIIHVPPGKNFNCPSPSAQEEWSKTNIDLPEDDGTMHSMLSKKLGVHNAKTLSATIATLTRPAHYKSVGHKRSEQLERVEKIFSPLSLPSHDMPEHPLSTRASRKTSTRTLHLCQGSTYIHA